MFNDFIKTYSYGIWEFLRPRALVEGVHACLRILLDKLCNTELLKSKSYNYHGSSSINSTVTVQLTDISAGVGDYDFFIKNLPNDAVLIGRSPDSRQAVLFADFIPYGDGYLFKENPSVFGTTSNQGGTVFITFCVAGGVREGKHQPQFKVIYNKTANALVYRAIQHVTAKGLICNGISNSTVKASAGISVATEASTINRVWSEGNMTVALTDGEVLCCPTAFVTEPVVGMTIQAGDTLETLHPIAITTDTNKWLVDLTGTSYQEAAEAGIITVDASKQSMRAPDIELLAKYTPTASSLHIVSKVTTVNDEHVIISTDVVAAPDTLYVFYTNSSNIPNKLYEGGSKACSAEFLRALSSGEGCWRVTDCVKSGNNLYGLTSNSTIFGELPKASSKIYAIASVVGGNTYRNDVVYSYCRINPVIVGSGIEAVIVDTLT